VLWFARTISRCPRPRTNVTVPQPGSPGRFQGETQWARPPWPPSAAGCSAVAQAQRQLLHPSWATVASTGALWCSERRAGRIVVPVFEVNAPKATSKHQEGGTATTAAIAVAIRARETVILPGEVRFDLRLGAGVALAGRASVGEQSYPEAVCSDTGPPRSWPVRKSRPAEPTRPAASAMRYVARG